MDKNELDDCYTFGRRIITISPPDIIDDDEPTLIDVPPFLLEEPNENDHSQRVLLIVGAAIALCSIILPFI